MSSNIEKPHWKYQKPREEIEAALHRQLSNMRRSLESFDRGAIEEAERVASSIYIICQDSGRNQKSLLGQLGLRDRMKIPETISVSVSKERGVVRCDPPLVGLNMDEDGRLSYVAPIATEMFDRMDKVAFSRWWEQKVYSSRKPGLSLSRKNLVFGLRTQDGGGHVDETLRDEAYYRFSRLGDHMQWNPERTLGVYAATNNGEPLPNGHWMTMRQMGWELDQALIAEGF